MAAIFVANLLRYQQEGLSRTATSSSRSRRTKRAATSTVSRGSPTSHRDLIEAEFGLNEGGGGRERNGKKLFNAVQAPRSCIAISISRSPTRAVTARCRCATTRSTDSPLRSIMLGKFDFPINLNEVTHAFFERTAAARRRRFGAAMKAVVQSNGADAAGVATLAQSPAYNSMLRTTCVATMLQAVMRAMRCRRKRRRTSTVASCRRNPCRTCSARSFACSLTIRSK